ncbi:MAG: permease-like cell division protein FtsX [Gammaproteobacteria bacterium]|jgi:cell division transport system permease protein|nr:cell division protein [Chromatiales bacterium]MDP6675623.1 permease-like cell division protein FtsX [Gammaproteobacteria bacterium]
MLRTLNNYLIRHAQNCIGALGNMVRKPIASMLTIAVIGIALALPSALSIMVKNGRALAGGLEDIRDFSVYTKPGVSLGQAEDLRARLDEEAVVRSTQLISASEALQEFRNDTELGDLVRALTDNPLPHTIVVRPTADAELATLKALKNMLVQDPLVDLVKLDTDWVRRLSAILDLAWRTVWVAAILLVGAVIVIIGNTIRLDIENRRAEIEVSKLFGASDGFVRRPFLYTGFWYGLFGGVFAIVLLVVSLWLLSGPVERLIRLYGGGFKPFGIDGSTLLTVFTIGLIVGLSGAWSAVARHLAAIQPRV